jgi:hypothetical protein
MSRDGKARQSTLQLDMFGDADPLIGIEVNVPRHCECGQDILRIGPGHGPYRASLQCPRCGRDCGCLSHIVAKFLSEVVEHFGRPSAPVQVRVPQTKKSTPPLENAKSPPAGGAFAFSGPLSPAEGSE